jgi:hypothetical protein
MDRNYLIPFPQLISESLDSVDEWTSNNIKEGFVFDNHLFSMSENAQLNWSNIKNTPETLFPLTLGCKDNSVYVLDYKQLNDFYNTSLFFKMSLLKQGTEIKQQILKCDEVSKVLDILNKNIH